MAVKTPSLVDKTVDAVKSLVSPAKKAEAGDTKNPFSIFSLEDKIKERQKALKKATETE